MSVLITGANGFLGSAIVRHALDSGISLYATDLHESPAVAGVNYGRSDIVSSPGPLPKGLTCVIHAAGLAHVFDSARTGNAPFHSVNVTGTVNMLQAAVRAGVGHFILISSVSVYGPFTEGSWNEDTPCKPAGPYASSKYEAEIQARDIAVKTGISLTILRLATLYGEQDPGNVGRLVRLLDRGRFMWIGTGANRKSLLYKEDAARACVRAASRPASGIGTYNVSAPPCTMREIVDNIAHNLGRGPLPVVIPAPVALFLTGSLSLIPLPRMSGFHQTVKKWLAEDVYDAGRFNEVYDFKTKMDIREGLRREVDWYRSNRIAR